MAIDWQTLTPNEWSAMTLDDWAAMLLGPPAEAAAFRVEAAMTFIPFVQTDAFTGSKTVMTFVPRNKADTFINVNAEAEATTIKMKVAA